MKEVLAPSTKFLFFIRDPIKRAYSAWNMNRSKDREQRPFDDCVEANLTNLDEYRSYGTAEYHLVQRGFYQGDGSLSLTNITSYHFQSLTTITLPCQRGFYQGDGRPFLPLPLSTTSYH